MQFLLQIVQIQHARPIFLKNFVLRLKKMLFPPATAHALLCSVILSTVHNFLETFESPRDWNIQDKLKLRVRRDIAATKPIDL